MPKRKEGKRVQWTVQMDKFLNALVIDKAYKKGNVSWKGILERNIQQFQDYGIDRPAQLRDRYRSKIHGKRTKTPMTKSPRSKSPNKAPEQHTQKRRINLWTPERDLFLYLSIGGNVYD